MSKRIFACGSKELAIVLVYRAAAYGRSTIHARKGTFRTAVGSKIIFAGDRVSPVYKWIKLICLATEAIVGRLLAYISRSTIFKSFLRKRSMKFYVAAFVEEKRRVQTIYRRLSDLGHSITVDWTAELGISGKDRDMYPEQVQAVAARDMNGVKECDAFILLSDPADGRAKYAELGAAIMSCVLRGKPKIYVLGDATHYSVFFYHPTVQRVQTLEEILRDIGEA